MMKFKIDLDRFCGNCSNPKQCQAAAHLLRDLKPELAKNCLLLLQHSLQTKIIQSPLGYLHYLVKAARQGTLDCSLLTPATPNTSTLKANPADTQQRLRALQAEIYTLDQLFKQSGTAMDERSAARRTAWMVEYKQLQQTLSG